MNILYLHGLDSALAPEKRPLLEKYGKVFSPAIDYRKEYNSIEMVVEQFKNNNIKVVIGSSLGGFVAYYVSDAYKIPCLLFNPALLSRTVGQKIPIYPPPYLSYKQIVLGIRDSIVNPKDTLTFLSKNLQNHTNYDIHVRQDLEHRVAVEIFEQEVKHFFNRI